MAYDYLLFDLDGTLFQTDICTINAVRKICEEIQFFLERIPPQIRHNIEDQGIFVAGGTSRIPDMEWFLKQETGQKIRLSDYFEFCTVCGLKEIMGNRTLRKWVR